MAADKKGLAGLTGLVTRLDLSTHPPRSGGKNGNAHPNQEHAPKPASRLRLPMLLAGLLLIAGLIAWPAITNLPPVSPEKTQPGLVPAAMPASEPVSGELAFKEPPAVRGQALATSEIAWCLALESGLVSLKGRFSDREEVRRYNQLVGHYNSRCSEYKYQEKDLAQARAQVESLGGEPAARLAALIGQPLQGSSQELAEEQIVAMQRLLDGLGYYHGSWNGKPGEGLTKAIMEFQKDFQLTGDGRPTPEVYAILQRVSGDLANWIETGRKPGWRPE